jgi:hypothetical protein
LRKQFFQKANTIPVIGTWTEDFALISFGQKYYNGQGLAVKQVRIKGDWKTVKERKSIAGHLFGTVKRVMGTDCHLYKGKAGGKFAQAFRTWNLKRAINIPGTEKLPKAHA